MTMRLVITVLAAAVFAACGGDGSAGADRGGQPGRGGPPGGGMGGAAGQATAAVPVRTEDVSRGSISDDLQSAEAGQDSGDQEGGSDDSQQGEGEAPDESLPSRASGAGGEKEFDPSKAGQDAAAIDWFDQLGSQDEEQGPEGVAEQAADDAEGRGPGGALEQLLDQVEGNPAALLRNQFILEEERLMGAQGGRLYEPRPW